VKLTDPLRRVVDRSADRIAQRVADRLQAPPAPPTRAAAAQVIELDYPLTPVSRYGFDKPPHPQLQALLTAGDAKYAEVLVEIGAFHELLAKIPLRDGAPGEPRWINDFLPGLDAAALYAFTALRKPATYLEVGSGNSTSFVRRSITDHQLPTRIVSVDPHPRAEIDHLCDEMIRTPVERVDLALFDQLQDGDILFIDNSHRCFQGSDATVMLTEVLPNLPPGVLVGIHDIFLPHDYPEAWTDRYYSEQYVLTAFLLGGHRGFEIVLPAFYASHNETLRSSYAALHADPELRVAQWHGGAFWMASVAPS
jgi:hypothetical protein